MKPVKNANSGAEPGPRAGQLIGDRYRLDRLLERGAMGSVWRAEQVRLRAPVAVKFLDPSLIGDKEMHDRFIQEARSAAAVRSAHVVQVFDYGTEEGLPYIAMELLDGENLDARLCARGTLSPAELDRLFGELARGIGQAHAIGVIHRDLKPGNIFLAREGEHEVTKIVDFGIAKVRAGALRMTHGIGTQLGTLLGTPQYMSPEQVRGLAALDHRTDLWAMAVIACECLTGRCPFSGATLGDLTVQICTEKPPAPSSLGPVPWGFDQWFFKATHKKPHKRFQSAEEMAERLHAVLAPVALASAEPARPARRLGLPSRSEVRLAYTAVLTWKGNLALRLSATWITLERFAQRLIERAAPGWQRTLRWRNEPSSGRAASLGHLVERHAAIASVALLGCGLLMIALTAMGGSARQRSVVPDTPASSTQPPEQTALPLHPAIGVEPERGRGMASGASNGREFLTPEAVSAGEGPATPEVASSPDRGARRAEVRDTPERAGGASSQRRGNAPRAASLPATPMTRAMARAAAKIMRDGDPTEPEKRPSPSPAKRPADAPPSPHPFDERL